MLTSDLIWQTWFLSAFLCALTPRCLLGGCCWCITVLCFALWKLQGGEGRGLAGQSRGVQSGTGQGQLQSDVPGEAHTPSTTKNSLAPPSLSMSIPRPALLLACPNPFKLSVTQFLSFGHSYNLLPAAHECVTLFILRMMSATKYLVSAATEYAHHRVGALLLSQPSALLRPFCFWVYILTATKKLG